MAVYVFPAAPPPSYNWWDTKRAKQIYLWTKEDYDEKILAAIMEWSNIYEPDHWVMVYAFKCANYLADTHVNRQHEQAWRKPRGMTWPS